VRFVIRTRKCVDEKFALKTAATAALPTRPSLGRPETADQPLVSVESTPCMSQLVAPRTGQATGIHRWDVRRTKSVGGQLELVRRGSTTLAPTLLEAPNHTHAPLPSGVALAEGLVSVASMVLPPRMQQFLRSNARRPHDRPFSLTCEGSEALPHRRASAPNYIAHRHTAAPSVSTRVMPLQNVREDETTDGPTDLGTSHNAWAAAEVVEGPPRAQTP